MNETLIIVLSIGYFLATLSLIAALVFLIVVAVELRRGINTFKEFINGLKIKLEPALNEAERVIQGVKSSVDDVNQLTEKARELSKLIEKLSILFSEFISTFDSLKSTLNIRSNALKTAISVAVSVFLENLKKGGK